MITVGTFLPSRIIKFTYLFTSCLGCIVLPCSLVSEVTALILHYITRADCLACWIGVLLTVQVSLLFYYDHSSLLTLCSLLFSP